MKMSATRAHLGAKWIRALEDALLAVYGGLKSEITIRLRQCILSIGEQHRGIAGSLEFFWRSRGRLCRIEFKVFDLMPDVSDQDKKDSSRCRRGGVIGIAVQDGGSVKVEVVDSILDAMVERKTIPGELAFAVVPSCRAEGSAGGARAAAERAGVRGFVVRESVRFVNRLGWVAGRSRSSGISRCC